VFLFFSKNCILSLKNSTSTSTQMNEQVESLQIDLNSIKEFFEKNIANNTFNQFDSYAINNVMNFYFKYFRL
jgi:hypothetical protein